MKNQPWSPAAIGTGLLALAAAAFAAAVPAHAYTIADGLDLTAKFYADATVAEHTSDSGFHLKRSYVTLRAHLPQGLIAQFTLDQSSEAGKVFVKHAYVEKAIPHGMVVRAGQGGTPYVPYDEAKFWVYRFVLRTFTDQWGLQTSTDLGVSVLGSAANGGLGYQVSLLNGEGFQHTPDGKGMALAGRVNADQGHAHFGAWGHVESTRAGVKHYNPTREGVFGFWDDPRFRAGAQFALANDGSAFGTPAGTAAGAQFDNGNALNFQGRVKLPVTAHETWAFGRYDLVQAQRHGGHRFLAILGVVLDLMPGLLVAPDVRLEDTGISSRGTETTVAVHAQLLL